MNAYFVSTAMVAVIVIAFVVGFVAPVPAYADTYGGYEPYYSYDSYAPTYSYDSYEPYYSYDSYAPMYSYDSYEPTYSYDYGCGSYCYPSDTSYTYNDLYYNYDSKNYYSYLDYDYDFYSKSCGSYCYPSKSYITYKDNSCGSYCFPSKSYKSYSYPTTVAVKVAPPSQKSETVKKTDVNYTSTTKIDNSIDYNYADYSINDSFNITDSYNTNITNNTATVYPATPQYPVAYQYPVYHPYPQVALSQIPYTGFDGGLLWNSVYWAGLALVAISAAYLIVYYVPAFAGLKARMPERVMEAPMNAARSLKRSVDAGRTGSLSEDSMTFVRSEKGSAPRIVVARS